MSDEQHTPLSPGTQLTALEEALKQRELEVRVREADIKDLELDVRRLEADTAKRTATAPLWRSANPFLIAVVGGIVTLAGNAWVAYYNGYTTRNQETLRAENALNVEREKSKAALILQAIATNDTARASTNIQFFIASGLLPDDDHKILEAARRFTPVLPAAFATSSLLERVVQLTPAQALVVAKLMERNISARVQTLQQILKNLDPTGKHLQDGAIAKAFLQQWVVQDDRDSASQKQWADALDTATK